MTNPAAKHADEFRRETADCIISTVRPIIECCAEPGLNSKTASKWVQNRRPELAGGPDPKAEDRVFFTRAIFRIGTAVEILDQKRTGRTIRMYSAEQRAKAIETF